MTRILLAEDEEILRMLVLDTLEDEGYDIDEASDGQEAYEMIQKNHYDLVILDYMMPNLTGLEVVEMTRNVLRKKEIKMMILSAKNQQTDRERMKEAGADYFMSKPFSPLQLLETIGEILGE